MPSPLDELLALKSHSAVVPWTAAELQHQLDAFDLRPYGGTPSPLAVGIVAFSHPWFRATSTPTHVYLQKTSEWVCTDIAMNSGHVPALGGLPSPMRS